MGVGGGKPKKETFTDLLKIVTGWVGPLTRTEVLGRSISIHLGKTDPTRRTVQVVTIFNLFIINSFLGGFGGREGVY